jgi:uncharacterized protein (DUF3084 family)
MEGTTKLISDIKEPLCHSCRALREKVKELEEENERLNTEQEYLRQSADKHFECAEALQEKVNELEEERWKVVATRNAACKRAEQAETREKVLREALEQISNVMDGKYFYPADYLNEAIRIAEQALNNTKESK